MQLVSFELVPRQQPPTVQIGELLKLSHGIDEQVCPFHDELACSVRRARQQIGHLVSLASHLAVITSAPLPPVARASANSTRWRAMRSPARTSPPAARAATDSDSAHRSSATTMIAALGARRAKDTSSMSWRLSNTPANGLRVAERCQALDRFGFNGLRCAVLVETDDHHVQYPNRRVRDQVRQFVGDGRESMKTRAAQGRGTRRDQWQCHGEAVPSCRQPPRLLTTRFAQTVTYGRVVRTTQPWVERPTRALSTIRRHVTRRRSRSTPARVVMSYPAIGDAAGERMLRGMEIF